ncbi:MAG TPA: hypothetical protein VGF88_20150 [Acidobacteriaceae bacterium]|jgi:hypothetical protein
MLPFGFPVATRSSFSDEERPAHARAAEKEADTAAIRKHLTEVAEGAAFRSSHRSAQFLRYVVEQTIEGHLDSLKERVIGVELFGRSPTYDTGEDAIVRVTASDVRKRLLQHYGQYGATMGLRITLPLGSYVPLITREDGLAVTARSPAGPGDSPHLPASGMRTDPEPNHLPPRAFGEEKAEKDERHSSRAKSPVMTAAALLCAAGLFVAGQLLGRYQALTPNPLLTRSPWRVFLNSPHPTRIVFSDPAMVEVQELTGHQISASDYANRQYLPDPKTLSPEVSRACSVILGAGISAAVDPPIAVEIAALGQSLAKKLQVGSARDLRMADLQTDDNFVFLGSPRSDPWTVLFSDQLDFRFVFNQDAGQEIIHNYRPRGHEMSDYLPTALGGGTGESYAIVALVQNLDQKGQALLLAGADAEGTEAAGRFVTDLPRFTTAVDQCGGTNRAASSHFEFLLRLNTMAGSPHNTDVVACHLLAGSSGH